MTCPNQDVAYGLGFFSLDEETVVIHVPDFGDRFWIYALYDARTDQFAQIGKPYGSKPGFYLLVGPSWKGEVPAGIAATVRSSTELANIIPRVFLDDTDEDRAAIQTVLDQIVAYPLKDFDGTMKTIDMEQGARDSGVEIRGRRRDRLGRAGEVLRPAWHRSGHGRAASGEEAMYAQFRAVLAAAAKDPAVKQALVEAAVETERDVISPFFAWNRHGRPAGNGWNRSTNNAQFGVDYFNRTGTAKSNMFDNKPTETQYFYTDDDATGTAARGPPYAYEVHLPGRPGTSGSTDSGRSRFYNDIICSTPTISAGTRSAPRTRTSFATPTDH